jgi:glycine dehydrogenase subunit 1
VAEGSLAHPYMANSLDAVKQEMLETVGVDSVEELFEQIPDSHLYKEPINLPPPLTGEVDLRRDLLQRLAKNEDCESNLSFLGAGCWQHYVPAVCDEIASRYEFLTNIWGTPASDFGRNQGLFEFSSQIGELVSMDCVGMPVYSWGTAAGHAIRLATRLNGRRQVLIPKSVDPERLAVIRNYCEPREMSDHIDIVMVDYDDETAMVDVADVKEKISSATAAVYFENPSYLGAIEANGDAIAALASDHGAEVIVGVDPSSLGLLAAPGDDGADITVGTIQPLGLHLQCGGGLGGFIATPDEERYVKEYPTLLVSLADTQEPGERGFGMTLLEQTSYDAREEGKDWTGHTVHLWGVVSASYMALLGPQGFVELGDLIVSRSHYLAQRLADRTDLRVVFPSRFFKELVVNFDGTGKTVAEVNRRLRDHRIFGGKDLSSEFPELGQSALYAVTEIHTQANLDYLVDALREVTAS